MIRVLLVDDHAMVRTGIAALLGVTDDIEVVGQAADGDGGARAAQRALQHLDRYISGTQLGITLASLALGWIGEPALAAVIDLGLARLGVHVPEGVAHSGAAVATAFIVITFLHIVLGELAPKSLAIRVPEAVGLWSAVPLYGFYWAMYPAIWLLNESANLVLRVAGLSGVVKTIADGDRAGANKARATARAQRDLNRFLTDLQAMQRRGAITALNAEELTNQTNIVRRALQAA